MLVDEVRLRLNLDTVRAKPLDGGMQIVDLEVEQGRWRARIEEQPSAAKIEEQQSRWVEACGGLLAQKAAVEGVGSVKIFGAKPYLYQAHRHPPGKLGSLRISSNTNIICVTPEELRTAAGTLHSSAIHLLRSMRPLDRKSGLTPARLSALSVLVFGGARPLGRLAADEGVTSPTMTRIVDGLVALRLAERRTHSENGRIVTVAATPEGVALMRTASQRRITAIADALAHLEPKELSALLEAMPVLPELAANVWRRVKGEAATDGSDSAVDTKSAVNQA
jgi:DNA-binding MarR family transcriptional regulator